MKVNSVIFRKVFVVLNVNEISKKLIENLITLIINFFLSFN